MLKRKIEATLMEWKNSDGHKPLVIMGIRQCGKTFIVRYFASENYKNVVYINFIRQPELINAFTVSKDIDTILFNLSAQINGMVFSENDTCTISRRIQDWNWIFS